MVRSGSGAIELAFGTQELLAGIGVPVLISTPDRIGVWANQQFAELFGIDGGPEEIIGQPLAPIAERVSYRYRDPAAFLSGIREAIERGASSTGQALELLDGRWISRSFSTVTVGGDLVAYVWRYDDVTDVHRKNLALERTTAVLEAMVRAHGPAVRSSTGKELFSELLTALIDVTESAYGFIGEVVHGDDGLPFLRSWAVTDIAWDAATKAFVDDSMRQRGYLEFHQLESLYGVTLRTGEVVVANDPEHDPRAFGLPPGHPPLGAYLGLPISLDGRLIGMAGLAGRASGYDDEIVTRVQPIISACASMIEAYAIERERREGEAALREALERAEHANAAKTRLLGRVSHELRTPLNAVLGFGQLLARELNDPRALRWVAQIEQAGEHVLAQVEELLDLAAAESGHLHVDLAPVAVDVLVATVLGLVAPLAEERRITVSAEPSGLWVEADPDRLRVVLLNLVSNAIKYNSEGGNVFVASRLKDGTRVEIVVSDDGPGIPEAKLEQAFVMFERLDGAGRGVPGAGLGLAIAREYTRAMGGALHGRPRDGGGVEMMVELSRAGVSQVGRGQPWVLYVEDNELNAELVSEYLTSFEQIPVQIAPTLAAARSVLATRVPSVLLLDLNLPDGFGGDLIAELMQSHAALPVIVITADAFAAADVAARYPHLRGTLVKPLRFEDLSASVQQCLTGAATD